MLKAYRLFNILVPLIGIIIGGAKVIGIEIEVQVFNSLSVPGWFRVMIGVIQLICAGFLFIPKLQMWGVYIGIGTLALVGSLMLYKNMLHFVPAPVFGICLLTAFGFLNKQFPMERVYKDC